MNTRNIKRDASVEVEFLKCLEMQINTLSFRLLPILADTLQKSGLDNMILIAFVFVIVACPQTG